MWEPPPNEGANDGRLPARLNGTMALVDVTCQLAGQYDLDHILNTVTAGVCQALSCERASLFLFDPERNELFTRVVTELEIEEIRSSIENGITGWVARKRQVANIPDPKVDARWNSSIDRQTGFQTRNIVAAPVVSGRDQRLLGVLELLNKSDGDFDDFDVQLLQAFTSHAANALERAQLLEEAKRSQEMRVSIEVGRTIQASFLPETLPDIPGYELAAWWRPAEAVGGDYYDVLDLPDGRLGLVVADVSGHGVGPSLIMAAARAMLHVLTRTCSNPDEILSLLAETIVPDLKNGRFITILMAALDPRTHELQFANAGHAPVLHFERSTGTIHKLAPTGLPVGFSDDCKVELGPTIVFAPGDMLLLATDGVVEVHNSAGEMFGRRRFEDLIRRHHQLPAAQLIEALSQAVADFCPDADPSDDATLMIVERKLDGSAAV